MEGFILVRADAPHRPAQNLAAITVASMEFSTADLANRQANHGRFDTPENWCSAWPQPKVRNTLFAPSPAPQFARQFFRPVNLVQRFQNRRRMDRCRPALFVTEGVIPRQALQIAIEDDANEFARRFTTGLPELPR